MPETPEMHEGLDLIVARVRESSPFDLSPRGVRFRPDNELSAQLERLVAEGDSAVPLLAAKLEAVNDPLVALVWLFALTRIRTVAAEAAIQAFVARVEREEFWGNSFPGRREILLFLGRIEA